MQAIESNQKSTSFDTWLRTRWSEVRVLPGAPFLPWPHQPPPEVRGRRGASGGKSDQELKPTSQSRHAFIVSGADEGLAWADTDSFV